MHVLSQVECSRRSSLYSMALHWHVPADGSGGQLRVAAGSAFLHVLVWQLPAVSFASLRQAAGKTAGAELPPAPTLRWHTYTNPNLCSSICSVSSRASQRTLTRNQVALNGKAVSSWMQSSH